MCITIVIDYIGKHANLFNLTYFMLPKMCWIFKVPLYTYVPAFCTVLVVYIRICSIMLLSGHVCTYVYNTVLGQVEICRRISGENCSEVSAILLPFYCD